MDSDDEAEVSALVDASGLRAQPQEGGSGLVGMDEVEGDAGEDAEASVARVTEVTEVAEVAEPTAFITEPRELQTVEEETDDQRRQEAGDEERNENEAAPEDDDDEEEEEERSEAPELRPQPTLESLLEDDELWDTDLEEEVPDEDHEDLHDTTGRSTYRKLCSRLGTVPVKYFMQHITDGQLVMRYHGLGPLGTRAIAKPLSNNLSITRLDLRGNWMEPEGGAALAKMLEENSYVVFLDLADNKLGDAGAAPICRAMQTNASVTELSLAGNGIGEASAEALHELLAANRTLVRLDLSRNCLGADCGCRLGAALGANEFLEEIDLGSNCIAGRGAAELARGLRDSFRLKRCRLAWNGFAEEGGLAVADMLRQNQVLLDLSLQGNRLNDRAAVAIGNAVAGNESLESLHLGNNFLYTPALVQIVAAIVSSETTPLSFLSFKDIPVDFEFVKIVEKQVAKATREFRCEHGPVLRAGNTRDDLPKAAVDIKSPIVLLKEHILVNDFRFVERLAALDADGTKTVTLEQFASVMDEMKIPYYRSQLLEMQRKLDKLGDGSIFFGDFLPPERPRRESAIIRSRPPED